MPESPGQGRFPKLRKVDEAAGGGIRYVYFDNDGNELLSAAVLGALSYQGTWNATTNSPTIPAAASGNKGWYYKVATAGSTSIDGIAEWKIGDWIVSNGTTWDKVDNTEQFNGDFSGLTGALATSQAPSALKDHQQAFFLNGNGSVLSPTNPPGVDFLRIRVASHLKGWHVFCDAVGTLALDLQKSDYASYPTFTTLGTTNPSLSSEQKKENTSLNVALAAGDLLRVVPSGTATTITSAAIFPDLTVD